MRDEISLLDATDQAALVRRGDLKPQELVEGAIARILQARESFRVFEGATRRCLRHVFPYAVIYAGEDDAIVILAVMQCRRRPGYWRERSVE